MFSTRSQFLKHLFRPLVCNACGRIVREGKKVARVVKQEAKAERKAVEVAIRELAELQKMQREAVKEEAKAYAAHARTLRKFHKEELTFFAARARFERAQAGLQVCHYFLFFCFCLCRPMLECDAEDAYMLP